MVKYVGLWSILPSLEGEDKNSRSKGQNRVNSYRGKTEDWKRAALQTSEERSLQHTPCSLSHPCVIPVMLPWHWQLL